MTNLLTPSQASNALRCSATDPRMLDLLPQVDKFVERATGRDWTQDTLKHPTAVSAATMLLVSWYENPAMLGIESAAAFGLHAALAQLEAEALKYRVVEFCGRNGAGGISVCGFQPGDEVIKLVGVYGVTGDQSAKFATRVDLYGVLQQTSALDLSGDLFTVVVKNPAEDVTP